MSNVILCLKSFRVLKNKKKIFVIRLVTLLRLLILKIAVD